jgi:hypothetical protein
MPSFGQQGDSPLRKFLPQRGTAWPFRFPRPKVGNIKASGEVSADTAPRLNDRPHLLRHRNGRLALPGLEPPCIELPVVRRAVRHERLSGPGLPLQSHDFAGAQSAENADVQQAQIVHILDGPNQRQYLFPRHHGPINRLGLRHGHVFSGIFGQIFLLLGHVGNRAHVGETVANHGLRIALSAIPFSQTWIPKVSSLRSGRSPNCETR